MPKAVDKSNKVQGDVKLLELRENEMAVIVDVKSNDCRINWYSNIDEEVSIEETFSVYKALAEMQNKVLEIMANEINPEELEQMVDNISSQLKQNVASRQPTRKVLH